ncbi:MAG: DUF3267 domain-containing protein [Candidatus Latescibacteria bacterium]|nr:DUF3267 domain-containing protein [Candidatus Latescibacterota bacterium]
MTSLSRSSIQTGKVIFVLLLGCFLGYMMHLDKAEDQLRGEQLTLEEYVADFEAHKARLSDPPISLVPGMLIMTSLLVIAIAVYESMGRLIGLLLQKTGLVSDSDESDEEVASIPGRTDMSVSTGRAGLLMLALIPIVGALAFAPSFWIWGRQRLRADLMTTEGILVFLFAFLVGVVLHELLHGAGFIWFGKGRWKDLKFGIKLRYMAAYATTSSPLTASAYRGAVALPGLVLGVLPLLAGMALGNGWVIMYGYTMTVCSGGDLAILWAIRKVDGSATVIDHTHRAGCWVLDDPAESASDQPGE